MRVVLIVVLSPSLDLGAGVVERLEPVDVQALVAEAPVERFDRGVVRRLAPTTEVQHDALVYGHARAVAHPADGNGAEHRNQDHMSAGPAHPCRRGRCRGPRT